MPANALFQQSFMWAPGLRIAGGTDEILKNIIAERVLGLPQDVRVDKDVPFEDLKQG
jgi:alkylation response protein AidB-like acyl-CoA dehydrogenase